VSGWAFAGLTALGLGTTGIALVALPLCAVWIAVALHLGRRQAARRGDPVERSGRGEAA
jgi:AAA family ATP:ADP antiporter